VLHDVGSGDSRGVARGGFAADGADDLCQERGLLVRKSLFSTAVDTSEGRSIIGHNSSSRR
jgi:hypothetical protein